MAGLILENFNFPNLFLQYLPPRFDKGLFSITFSYLFSNFFGLTIFLFCSQMYSVSNLKLSSSELCLLLPKLTFSDRLRPNSSNISSGSPVATRKLRCPKTAKYFWLLEKKSKYIQAWTGTQTKLHWTTFETSGSIRDVKSWNLNR